MKGKCDYGEDYGPHQEDESESDAPVLGGLASLPITVSDERAHCPLDGRHPTRNNEEPEK
jgi:hypothetical protein